MTLPNFFSIPEQVMRAIENNTPIVALESTVISHGLPRPTNYEVARQLEQIVRNENVIPATIGIIHGEVIVGLNDDQLVTLAMDENVRKVSRRDYPIAVARQEHGATTVAGTMIAAHLAGIRVFATGGIGGVHRGDGDDVSADLPELAMTPMVVVCAGAKSILDLPRTLEYLETAGVPVLGWNTDDFPAFYARHSGLPVDATIQNAEEAAAIVKAKWEMGLEGGVLVAAPPPADLALSYDEMESAVEEALTTAQHNEITGKALTPFLLEQISTITEGRSLDINIALLNQNARIAAQIANELAGIFKIA